MSAPLPDGVAEATRLLDRLDATTRLRDQVETFEAVLGALTEALSGAED